MRALYYILKIDPESDSGLGFSGSQRNPDLGENLTFGGGASRLLAGWSLDSAGFRI